MQTDWIEAVGIDESGSLWVKPATARFPYVYREALQVNWDAERCRLFVPKPREWSYIRWFSQIRDAARAQGVELIVEAGTSWHGLEAELRQAIIDAASKLATTKIK
jgi:Integron Cassette Protein Hfx_Cass5